MPDENIYNKSPTSVIFRNWAIRTFFGLALAYFLTGLKTSQSDLEAAFGIDFYAKFRGMLLIAGILMVIPGGLELLKIWIDYKKTGRINDDVLNNEKRL